MTVDDNDRSLVEERLFALLEPDEAAVQRLKERALSASSQHRSMRFLAVTAGLLALLGTCIVWQIGSRQTPPQVVTIVQSENDLMLVRTPDGSVWVLGPAEQQSPSPGAMEVVFEGGR